MEIPLCMGNRCRKCRNWYFLRLFHYNIFCVTWNTIHDLWHFLYLSFKLCYGEMVILRKQRFDGAVFILWLFNFIACCLLISLTFILFVSFSFQLFDFLYSLTYDSYITTLLKTNCLITTHLKVFHSSLDFCSLLISI